MFAINGEIKEISPSVQPKCRNPKASKGDFLGDDTGQVKITGEIRDPKHFKGLIYPYTEPTNEKI